MIDWVKTSERLPRDKEIVIVSVNRYGGNNYCVCLFRVYDNTFLEVYTVYRLDEVTHWAELTPPESEG